LLSAQGRRFSQNVARELAQTRRVVLLCGRYEGVDERVSELVADQELSIGDYVLSGGELGAAVILDATMRLLPGVLGNDASSDNESFESSTAEGAGGLLDHPQYTRPAEFRGLAVPEVLSGGNHDQIRRWRREQALRKTLRNRPDLLQTAELSPEERSFLRALEVQSKDSV
jgi:tRNA (guanine37-N1)-methyltransferase